MEKKSATSRLVIMAFLIAMEIILTRFCSINTPILRIGFGFLPVAMMGIMFWALYGLPQAMPSEIFLECLSSRPVHISPGSH